jgi:ferredoxin
MSIIGWSDWYGPDFLSPHGHLPHIAWGHPDSIDLAEAEVFGRQMALNSIRIYNGEKDLLPDRIPTPDVGENSLFAPLGSGGIIGFAGGAANATPHFDFTKCVYPRCDQCIENCPYNAIDFSVIAPAGLIIDKDSTVFPIVLKEACQQCGGLCERVCLYDAIAYIGTKGVRVFHEIDMTKCTYPKCTACMDYCPQDAIDVSKNPPVIHNFCENESLCFGVCPENAIGPTPTSMHIDEGQPGGRGAMGRDQGPMAGGPGGTDGPPQMPGGMGSPTVRFRSIVQEGLSLGTVHDLTVYPRVPIHEKLWPYHMDEE